MDPIYDFLSGTLFVPHTAAEYLRAIGDWKLGPHIYADAGGSIDSKIKFRHEHAHFSSYMASGLVDLHTFFKNQRLIIARVLIDHFANHSDGVLEVPLVVSEDLSEIARCGQQVIDQLRSLEALFLGYGTNKTPRQLFNSEYIESLFRLLAPDDDSSSWMNITLNTLYYRRFLRQLYYTTDVSVLDNAEILTPIVSFSPSEIGIPVTSRSVMEAYAITIEVIAEFVKAITTSIDIKRTHPKRLPAALDQPALLLAIEQLSSAPVSLDEYVSGAHVFKQGFELYKSVALVAFASMQVPVLEEINADTLALGSAKQLCPALRFMHIIDNINRGAIPHPRGVLDKDRSGILEWIDKAHKGLGDPWSLKICAHLFDEHRADPRKYDLEKQVGDLTLTGHAGRVNFFVNPAEMIGDAGIWLNAAPCWVRYVGTADGKYLSWINPTDTESVRLLRLMDINTQMVEAIVFGDVWHSTWGRMAAYNDISKNTIMSAAIRELYSEKPNIRFKVRQSYATI
ncbi:hypothetical protein [Terriglobus sp. TAA 43]|uniref:hypothetical protein n=1 Tax=Terriglobus sp. TAA 43 TaxID=278961 RepID=UPI0012ED1FCF|nr:hypothetical protein [Terriglobus sp. TAA 43]